jgi:formamidopyrimidine-DNA glycosylase
MYSALLSRLLMGIWMSKCAGVDTYIRPEGELGTAHFDFKVAHRGGEPCPICDSTFEVT